MTTRNKKTWVTTCIKLSSIFIHLPCCEINNNRNIVLSSRMGDNNKQTQEVNSSGNYIKILLVYYIYQCPASTFMILQWWPHIITTIYIYEVLFFFKSLPHNFFFFSNRKYDDSITILTGRKRKQMLNITSLTEY
jgi:hypothetical protein